MSSHKKILILGGGFGGINTFRELHKHFHQDKSVQITMVNRTNFFLFTHLIHEVATGSINRENVIEPIRKILPCCLQDLYIDEVKKIHLQEKKVELQNTTLDFDYLVLALGAETKYFNTPGAKEHCFALKTHEDAIRLKNHFIQTVERASKEVDKEKRKQLLRFVVIGGGPTGVELAAEMSELFYKTFGIYYAQEIIDDIEVILIQRDPTLIPMFSKKLQTRAWSSLRDRKVKVLANSVVTKIDANSVTLAEGTVLLTQTPIWVAGVGPTQVDFAETVGKNPRGCVLVNNKLNLGSYENVFVLGDLADCRDKNDKPLPALAQVAVKQSKIVAQNIISHIEGNPMQALEYRHSGSMISLGQWNAAGDIGPFHLSGALIWWLWRTVYLSKMISRRKKIGQSTFFLPVTFRVVNKK